MQPETLALGRNATSSIVELVRSKYKDDNEVQTLWRRVYENYMLRVKEVSYQVQDELLLTSTFSFCRLLTPRAAINLL